MHLELLILASAALPPVHQAPEPLPLLALLVGGLALHASNRWERRRRRRS